MRIRGGIPFLPVLMFLILGVGCSKSEAPKSTPPQQAPAASAAVEGKALFEHKCGVCHGIGQVTARKATKEQWMGIVKSMQGKKADWISDAEATKIVEYLASEHGVK